MKMKTFKGQRFDAVYDRNSGRTFSDAMFEDCYFEGCAWSITRDPRLRSTVRNMKFFNCSQRGCALDSAIVEDILVENLETHGQLLQTWGAVFKHLTLKGKIGRVMLSPLIAAASGKPHEQAAFDQANADYYADTDWALDIREAEFKECDIRGIPAKLIRRDPETQAVVTREKALLGIHKKLHMPKTFWSGWIDLFLEEGRDQDVVLVASKRDKDFKYLLEGLRHLRDAGVAETE